MNTEIVIANLSFTAPNIVSERTNGGWILIALDNNGRAIALTFVPDRP